jgi:hypothetical protein
MNIALRISAHDLVSTLGVRFTITVFLTLVKNLVANLPFS